MDQIQMRGNHCRRRTNQERQAETKMTKQERGDRYPSHHLRRAPGVMDGPGQDDAALAVDDHSTVVVGDGGRAAAGDGGGGGGKHEEEGQRERRGGHGATNGGAWEEHVQLY